VVIDGVMQERVTDAAAAIATTISSPERAMSAAVGDAALLLDIDMDELTRRGLLVSNRPRSANGEPSGLIDVVQPWHAMTGKDTAGG